MSLTGELRSLSFVRVTHNDFSCTFFFLFTRFFINIRVHNKLYQLCSKFSHLFLFTYLNPNISLSNILSDMLRFKESNGMSLSTISLRSLALSLNWKFFTIDNKRTQNSMIIFLAFALSNFCESWHKLYMTWPYNV